MATTILTLVSITLIIFVLLLCIQGKRLFSQIGLIGLFFAVYFSDNLLIVLTNRFNNLHLIPSHIWEGFLICNWSGKLYSIFLGLALAYFCKGIFSREDLGLTFHQNPGSVLPAVLVILALAAWAVWVGLSSPKGQLDLQTLLYLSIMPGLNEELIYRGLLLSAADRIIPPRSTLWAAPLGWGINPSFFNLRPAARLLDRYQPGNPS